MANVENTSVWLAIYKPLKEINYSIYFSIEVYWEFLSQLLQNTS